METEEKASTGLFLMSMVSIRDCAGAVSKTPLSEVVFRAGFMASRRGRRGSRYRVRNVRSGRRDLFVWPM